MSGPGQQQVYSGEEQLNPELEADFEELLESITKTSVKKVLARNKVKLVRKAVVNEEALQGSTKQELLAYGLLEGDAAVLKLAFPTPPTAGAGVPGQRLRRSKLKADQNEGIIARLEHNVCCKRQGTVQQVYELVEEKGFVLLKAPPRSGKTSLLQLLELGYPEDCVHTLNMTDRDPAKTWSEFFEERTKRSWHQYRLSGSGASTPSRDDDVVLALIDELQCAYPAAEQRSADCDPMDELWTYIKRLAAGDARACQMPLRIVAAAVYGDAPSFDTAGGAFETALLRSLTATPFEIGPDRQVWLHRSEPGQLALAYTAEEYDELWAVTWAGREAELFAGTATKQDILWVTAGQPGLVAVILDSLQQSVKGHSRRPHSNVQHLCDTLYRDVFRSGRLYAALQAVRSFLSLQELSDDAALRWRVLRPLLEAGFVVGDTPDGAEAAQLGDEERAILASCLRKGYLISHHHPVRGELYSCNTPLHMYYLQHQLLSARAQHVQQGPDSLAAFMRVIISRLSPQRLLQTLSVGLPAAGFVEAGGGGSAPAGNVLLERKLQMDLHAAALTLVPGGWNVCPDVGKVYGSTGLVDMWVSSPDKAVQWALEFLRNGSDLREHERRFEPGGKYHDLPHTQFAVIDLRTPLSPRPKARPQQDATYFVLFEEGYQAASMLRAKDMSVVWGPDTLLGDSC